MDPDENMREQVELARRIPDIENADELAQAADRLAELVLALAGWLESGGFPPFRGISREGEADREMGERRMTIFFWRAVYLLTGNCHRYRPDASGVCRVCRVPGVDSR